MSLISRKVRSRAGRSAAHGCLLAVPVLAAGLVLSHPVHAAVAGPPDADACTSFEQFKNTDCTLTWHGITIFGTYDIGLGYVTHGLPENGSNYEGEALVNRNGNNSQVLIAPNNLSQTGLGIKGREEILKDVYVVFNATSGINPQSGQLANASATDIMNNGLPRGSYSYAIDGARAGQVFNDEFYGGLSGTGYGTVTFGRQRSLGTDAMLQYDPANGAYAFSYIGYNGTMAGGGDTEDTRWDDSIKYRIARGPVHFGAMYKIADGSGGCYAANAGFTAQTCTPEDPHNTAYGFDLGGEVGRFAGDIVYQHYNQAISVLNPLLGAQNPTALDQATTNSINTHPISGGNLIDPTNTLYGIVTDNTAILAAARYNLEPVRFYAGYEHIRQTNPSHPLGIGASDQGGYFLSGVEDNNLGATKYVDIWWLGEKLALDRRTDLTVSFYHQNQNTFRAPPACGGTAGEVPSCSGSLKEASIYVDHHFTKRFDAYAGVAYSRVSGGLAIAIPHATPATNPAAAYNFDTNVAPVAGFRFVF